MNIFIPSEVHRDKLCSWSILLIPMNKGAQQIYSARPNWLEALLFKKWVLMNTSGKYIFQVYDTDRYFKIEQIKEHKKLKWCET